MTPHRAAGMSEQDRVICRRRRARKRSFDRAVRPKTLADYVGQPAVKAQMEIFIEAARSAARRWTTC